jgi:hypothetical protein
MSVRRIKFLQRIKVLQQDVHIEVSKPGPQIYFQARLQLASYQLPLNARIYIEAHQLMERIRFDLGTVGMPNPVKALEISSLKGTRVSFDLAVVDGATGRKVASADNLKPVVAGGDANRTQNSLLPVDTTKGLNGPYWRVDYSEKDEEGMKDAPVLLIDQAASSSTDLLGDASLRVAVLPSAMREILGRVLLVDEQRYEPGGRDWRNSWLRFATRLVGDEPPSLDVSPHEVDQAREECDAWIQRAVELFCSKHAFIQQLLASKSVA